jgi:hypothetical protein
MCLAWSPSAILAQEEGCVFGDRGRNQVFIQTIPGVGQVTYISGPHFECDGGVQIWADSAVAYENDGMSHLLGTVRYLEAGRELLADEARYFSRLGRLQAQGNMSIRDDAQGSSIENGELLYLRRTEFRDEETMTVAVGPDGRRPEALLMPTAPDSGQADSEPGTPYSVVSDRMFLAGADFTAAGTVQILRDGLLAFADSAEFRQAEGNLLLVGSARVKGETYDLEGGTITMASPDEATNEIEALRDARLASDDILLTSARIVVFMRDDALERLVATEMSFEGEAPPDSLEAGRPEASVEGFVLTADSLEVTASAQTVDRVFAAGTARSVSTTRDSLNVELLPEIARSDWLEGDTVIVTFAPTQPGAESGQEMTVETITALVGARSLYRLEPSDSTSPSEGAIAPAVHYVVGNQITIVMSDGQIEGMQVAGQTQGVHFEPLSRSSDTDTTATNADSTTVIDTTAVIDTLSNETPRPSAGLGEHPPEHPTRDAWSSPMDAPRKERTWTHP